MIIIGGGPAGSSAGTFLAKGGMKCLLLESEKFPRPHVGESLVPATTPVLRAMGALEKVRDAGFVKKFGAAWTSAQSAGECDVAHQGWDDEYRAEVTIIEQLRQVAPDEELTHTFHVDRGRFDEILLRHAEETGVEVREETAVVKVDFTEQPWVRVQVRNASGDQTVRARMIVDASGRRTVLGNHLRLKTTDAVFNQYALHSWFEGLDRGADFRADYIYIHFLPLTNSWVWQIPISESITSVGVVTQKTNLPKDGGSQEDFFWKAVSSRPGLYEKLRQTKMLRPLRAEGDYSYSMRQVCGDRFVLVGDAARFVDPIFSSGVSIALATGRFAAMDILEAARSGDFGADNFKGYEARMRRGCETWYEFISMYYRLNVLFTYFVNKPQYRIDVLRLLAGDVWDGRRPPVLDRMRQIVEQVEQDEKHIWHKSLGELTANVHKPQF